MTETTAVYAASVCARHCVRRASGLVLTRYSETGRVRDMEVMIMTVSDQTINNLSVQGTQGCVERASSRQRRLSSRRVFSAPEDMPARKRSWPPGRPLHTPASDYR